MDVKLWTMDYIELASTIFYNCLRLGKRNSNCIAFFLLYAIMILY